MNSQHLRPPVTSRLFGGLGNQMFQYATAYALARSLQRPLELEARDPAPALVAAFDIPERLITSYNHGSLRRRLVRRLRLPEWSVHRESAFHYRPLPDRLTRGVTLEGYFQSWRYFDTDGVAVRARFSKHRELSSSSSETARRIAEAEVPISIHIRRGDYLTSDALKVHGLLPFTYYKQGTRLLRSILSAEPTFFVFSDDPVWARQNVTNLGNLQFVSSPDAASWEDLILMSKCRHHLIANSSYSWWAAWLNAAPEKIVVAPRQWFTPLAMRARNVCDLFPESWLLI